LAVASAFLLWLQAVGHRDPIQERTYTGLPVRLSAVEDGLVVVTSRPATVDLVARGRASRLRAAVAEDFDVRVDLSGAAPGTAAHPIRVSYPHGIEIAWMSAYAVDVQLETIVQEEVPVRIEIRGAPDLDYAMGEVRVSPATTLVVGPASLVADVDRAVVEVNVSAATGQIHRESPVRVMAADGRPVTGVAASPATVQVTVNVFRLPDPVFLPIHVRLEGVPAPGFEVAEVTSDPTEVAVRADVAALQDVRWVFTAPVAIQGARESFRREVGVEMPAGAYRVEPPRVTVSVTIRSGAQSGILDEASSGNP
jgi:YbbR domain-containing protein